VTPLETVAPRAYTDHMMLSMKKGQRIPRAKIATLLVSPPGFDAVERRVVGEGRRSYI
jgi:hypothetical protein